MKTHMAVKDSALFLMGAALANADSTIRYQDSIIEKQTGMMAGFRIEISATQLKYDLSLSYTHHLEGLVKKKNKTIIKLAGFSVVTVGGLTYLLLRK